MLSGSERQRPRILLQHAPIMILDEATANLDCVTEREVTQTLNAISSGKTLIPLPTALRQWSNTTGFLCLRKERLWSRVCMGSLWTGMGFIGECGSCNTRLKWRDKAVYNICIRCCKKSPRSSRGPGLRATTVV